MCLEPDSLSSALACPLDLGLSPNGRGGWTPLRPLRGLQETRVATREESGVLGFPSRRGLTQGASRAAPGKSGLHARGEGERVLALESREGLSNQLVWQLSHFPATGAWASLQTSPS